MILDELFKLQDIKYRDFQVNLFPTLNSEDFIGVRTPDLRKLAKDLVKNNNYISFLNELPHKYFDENQLHGFIISEIKDYDECLMYLNKFLPFIDNWATCDQTSPKVFKNKHDKLLKEVKKWIKSKKTYTIRFGIGMLMQYYLDENFQNNYLDLVCNIKSNEYYVNMMRAWFFATALAKQYDSTISLFENKSIDKWTHNKAIQKAIESYRISQDKKDYLKSLKYK